MSEKDNKLNKGNFLYIGDQDKAEWGYPEGYPHSEISETMIVDKLEISGFTYVQDLDAYMGPSESIMRLLGSDPTLQERVANGKPFTIIWDGTPYDCVFNISMSGFGNPSLIYDSSPDTGEPFLINEHGILTKENNDSHTVGIKIVDEIIYPMDKKYLPVGLEVTFEYYNGSFTKPKDITYDDLMKATLSGEPITAKLFNANGLFTTDAFYVGMYADAFAFIVYAISEDSAYAHIFTCTSETGWKDRTHCMKAAANVPNAAGDTPTAAEFNALLNSLRNVGILATS